jgi:hypothetical protein
MKMFGFEFVRVYQSDKDYINREMNDTCMPCNDNNNQQRTKSTGYEVRFSLLESDGWARRNLKIKKYANKQTVTNAQHSHAQPT